MKNQERVKKTERERERDNSSHRLNVCQTKGIKSSVSTTTIVP